MRKEVAEEKGIIEEVIEDAASLSLAHQEALLMLAKGMLQVHKDKEAELTN